MKQKPISESIWFEQVDEAFLSFIKSIVSVKDTDGIAHPIYAFMRKPEEDFKVEIYPSISLYNLDAKRDTIRYYPDPVVVSRDFENSTLVEESAAIPFTLKYQMDFWSTFQTQMNDMTRQWLGAIPDKCFNLPVIDMAGNERSCFVLLKGGLQKSDFLEGDRRIYHSTLTYDIQVELDERMPVVKPMVSGIGANVLRTNK